jgi:hypothetical protein
MPLSVNTPSVNTLTRRAIKRVGKQSTGKEPLSSLTVGCLTGDLYDLLNSVMNLLYFHGQYEKSYLQSKGDMRHDTDRQRESQEVQ